MRLYLNKRPFVSVSDMLTFLASTCMASSMFLEMVCFLFMYESVLRLFPDAVEPIEREIRKFAASLSAVKDEQEYMMIRERTHRNTAESTNSRVKWWSILQAIVLFAVVAWQVWYLKVRLCPFP